jgi:NAD(P)-dependent dehydrogenase (short-subunit alcohol dehydrogenase family)
LRAEFGDVIDVTTVYPGYIRTPIHDASAEKGIQLEGMVPPEPLESAVAAMVRAALDEKPPRDLATTRSGTVNYAALRLIPRRWVDAGMRRQLRRAARKGSIRSEGIAADLHRRLTAKA